MLANSLIFTPAVTLWADARLTGYILEELGFPGVRQSTVVENVRVEAATGQVSAERWYPLTGLRLGGAAPGTCSGCSATTQELRRASPT